MRQLNKSAGLSTSTASEAKNGSTEAPIACVTHVALADRLRKVCTLANRHAAELEELRGVEMDRDETLKVLRSISAFANAGAAVAVSAIDAALVEASTMSESIRAIVEQILDNSAGEHFALLEAVVACADRLDAAVRPVLDASVMEMQA